MFLILGVLIVSFVIFSQQNTTNSEEIPIATCPICATITPSPTVTLTPTLSYEEKGSIFATAQAQRTITATIPPNYPTPAFPEGNRENGLSIGLDPRFTKVVNETIIGKYIIREWSYSYERLKFVTISALGQEQFIPSHSGNKTVAKIDDASGTDLTGDGNLEVVIRYHEDGNGANKCDYISIYSLHEDGPVLVLDRARSCTSVLSPDGMGTGSYIDFFEDLNKDGKFEFIAHVHHWPDDTEGKIQVWQYNAEENTYKLVNFEEANNLSPYEGYANQLFGPQMVSEKAGDVRWLWLMSYPEKAEVALTEILRYSGEKYISLIYKLNGSYLGHVFFSPVTLMNHDEDFKIMGLISMSIYDEYLNWNQEAKTELIKAGVEEARIQGYDAVVLFGDPDFYSGFGFVPAIDYGIQAEYELPDETFMILALKENALVNAEGVVKYPEAFWMIKLAKDQEK